MTRPFVAFLLATLGVAATAGAQPTLTVSQTIVTPGSSVNATVVGPPNQFFAIIGSAVNSGFSHGGVALAVGPDVVILATGTLSGAGQAVVPVTPPFNGTTLDRYYVQAATATTTNFVPLQASAGVILRNADDVAAGSLAYFGNPVTLPAGNYVLTGRALVTNPTGAEIETTCRPEHTSALAGSYSWGPATAHVPAGRRTTLPIVGVARFTGPVTITGDCSGAVTAAFTFQAVRVAAINP
jgi:hypothetical protein